LLYSFSEARSLFFIVMHTSAQKALKRSQIRHNSAACDAQFSSPLRSGVL
jgi:hypothetical protein